MVHNQTLKDPVATPEIDGRSRGRRSRDESIAAEPQIAHPELPPDASPSPLEDHMSLDIKESDWKIFRQVHETALDRFCQKVLSEVTHLFADTGKSNHERFGSLYGLIKNRDKRP